VIELRRIFARCFSTIVGMVAEAPATGHAGLGFTANLEHPTLHELDALLDEQLFTAKDYSELRSSPSAG
jgi:hypothetical protein